MTIAILAAMQEEIDLLEKALENEQIHEVHGFRYMTGSLSGQSVIVMRSGIGRVNAALSCALLLGVEPVSKLINTGTAGGLHPSVKPGDVVISTRLAYHDVDNRIWGYAFGQVPQMPAFYEADFALCHLAESVSLSHHRVLKGLITSGESFVASDEAVERIRHHFPDVCAVDMESTAVAQVCHQLRVPFVAIRAISDTADHQANMTHEEFLPLAAETSSQLVMGMLGKI